MTDNTRKGLRKHLSMVILAALVIFLLMLNIYLPYPLLFKNFLYLPDTEVGNNFLLYKYRKMHQKTPLMYDLESSDILIDFPDKNNFARQPVISRIFLPNGFMKVRLNLFDIPGFGNNHFLKVSLSFLNGSLYRSPAGVGWHISCDKKIFVHAEKFYAFSGSELTQIFSTDKNGVISSLLPGTAQLQMLQGELYYRQAGQPLEIYSQASGSRFVLTKSIDDFGNTLEIQYEKDRVAALRNNGGQEILFSYDEKGLLAKLSIARVNTYYFSYDSLDNLLKVEDDRTPLLRCTYNSLQNCHYISQIETAGNTVDLYYDILGRVTDLIEKGSKTHFEYMRNKTVLTRNGELLTNILSPQEQTLVCILPKSLKTSLNFDDRGRITYYKDVGEENTYSYDSKGNLIKKIDARGISTEYSYEESLKNRILEKRIDGRSIYSAVYGDGWDTHTFNKTDQFKCQYDPHGNVTSIEKNGAPFVAITHDTYGNILKTSFPDQSQYIFQYGSDGRLLSFVDRFSNQYKMIYDAGGLLKDILYPNGYPQTAFRNLKAPCEKYEQPEDFILSNDSSAQIDFLKNLVTVSSPFFRELSLGINELRQVRKVEINNSFSQDFRYDDRGDFVSFADSSGKGLFWGRNIAKNTERINLSSSEPVEITYDEANRISKLECGRTWTTFAYDESGNIFNTNFNNIVTQYGYENGKIASITYPDRTQLAYRYDSNGLLQSISYEKKNIADFLYNTRENGLKASYPNGITVDMNFTPWGFLADQNVSKDGSPLFNIIYAREDNVLMSIENNMRRVTFSYDAKGRIIRCSSPYDLSVEYTYDKDGNVTSLASGTQKREFAYRYFDNKRICCVKEPQAVTPVGSISLYGKIYGEGIEFMEVNNITAKRSKDDFSLDKFSLDLKSEAVQQQDGISFFKKNLTVKLFTKAGEQYSQTFSAGFLPDYSSVLGYNEALGADYLARQGKTTRFLYDDFYRISSITTPGESSLKYQYNVNGTVYSISDEKSSTVFIHDIYNNLIAVTDTVGNAKFKIIYDYSRNIPIGFIDAGNRFFSITTDHNGSVLYVFDQQGEPCSQYDYDCFGNIVKKSESTPSPILFRGMFLTDVYGLYIDQDRLYSPYYFTYLTPYSFVPAENSGLSRLYQSEKNLFPSAAPRPVVINTIRCGPYNAKGKIRELSVAAELSWIKMVPGNEGSIIYLLHRAMD